MSLRPYLALLSLLPAASPAFTAVLPPGPGREVVTRICSQCHSLKEIRDSEGHDREGWQEIVARMTDLGDNPATLDTVLDYLAAHFPP